MKKELLIGSHVSMSAPDYLVGSLNEALSYKANAFMIYTGAPQNSKRVELSKLKIDEFKVKLKENNIAIENVIVHAPYIINLASVNPYKHKIAIDVLKNEIIRTNAIGCKYLVLHPGNAVDCDIDTGINNIANSINEILDSLSDNSVVICLETMSGKGTEVGRNFDQLAKIISLINKKENIGVCLDTCHINDAGYDLTQFDSILDEFDQKIGLDYLHVIHLNDSNNQMNSHKDRHANIGNGTIGFDLLCAIAHNKRIESIPKILETPWYDNHALYAIEIQALRTKKPIEYK